MQRVVLTFSKGLFESAKNIVVMALVVFATAFLWLVEAMMSIMAR